MSKKEYGVTAEVISAPLKKDLEHRLAQYRTGLRERVFNALTVLEAAILQNLRRGAGLNVLTGKLLNSIGRSKKVTKDGMGYIGEIGPKGVPYAAIHEFGGTIVPTKAQALTIPMPDNQRRDGSPKVTVQEAFASKQSFIHDGIVFMRKGKKTRGATAEGEVVPLFALKKSVTVPERPFLSPAVASTQDSIINNFGVFLAATFKTDSE